MATEASNIYIPGLNPGNFNTSTRFGRFGKTAAGFGPNRGLSWLHRAGMHGAGKTGGWGGIYPGLGLGEGGLLDFTSYGIGGGRTLGAIGTLTPAGRGVLGLQAQARQYASIAGNIMKTGSWGQRAAIGGSIAMKAIGPAMTMMDAYQGYKQGGVMGGVKGAASSLATQYAFGVGLRAAGALATPVLIGAAIAGAGYGSFKLLQAGNARMKRQRMLEMGSPVVDPFGNGATMRQRSLQALMGSQINGRSAFGSEAQLMHVPVMR